MLDRFKRDAEQARFLADNRGQSQMGNTAMRTVSLVVSLTVGAIVAAFLLPIGISELVGVDTTSWSDGATALWDILDVIIVLSLFLFFISIALGAAENT